MKGEIPVCKRCCFCLPLRRGLLAWGYFKLIAEALIIPIMMWYLLSTLFVIGFYAGHKSMISRLILYICIGVLKLTSFITDFVATIVFIIGGHKKNVKLLRGFYFYSIAMLIMTVSLITASVGVTFWHSSDYRQSTWEIVILLLAAYAVVLVLQSYFLLLLRSEVIKLRNIGDFRFVNNAAEAECTMVCEEQVAVQIEEKGTEVV